MNNSIRLLVFILLVTSCIGHKKTKSWNRQIEFLVDTTFIKNYNVDGLTKIKALRDYDKVFGTDTLFETSKETLECYDFKTISLTDSLTAKIVLTSHTPEYCGDRNIKRVYLITSKSKGKQIDVVRIGKIRKSSNDLEFETSLVTKDTIWRQVNFLHSVDSAGQLVTKKLTFNSMFIIMPDGKIAGR